MRVRDREAASAEVELGEKGQEGERGKSRGTLVSFTDQATLTHREGDYREGKLGDRGMCCVREREPLVCKEPVENKPHINADTHRCRGRGAQ